jgi:hypothetical protein
MLNRAEMNKEHVDTFVYEMGRQERDLAKRAKIDFLQLSTVEWARVGQFADLLSVRSFLFFSVLAAYVNSIVC